MPGSWTCPTCIMGGRWPSAECVLSMSQASIKGGLSGRKQPPGEDQFPGRAPRREIRRLVREARQLPCRRLPRGVPGSPVKADALALVTALRCFVVPEHVLSQVQASLVPSRNKLLETPEKALADRKAQLHILRQRVAKHKPAVANAKESYERSAETLL